MEILLVYIVMNIVGIFLRNKVTSPTAKFMVTFIFNGIPGLIFVAIYNMISSKKAA